MQVAQVSFRSLGRTQKEAVMAILCALDDDALHTMHHHGHGEVTLEWHVPASHPILEVLPEPLTIRGRPSQTPVDGAVQHRAQGSWGQGPSHAAPGPQKQVTVLRDGHHNTTAAVGRKASPTAAAARRGASARRRSISPGHHSPASRDASGGAHLGGGGGASPRAPRSVQWAFKLIDEVLCACRKMQVDLSVCTCVEELVQHILTTRFGVTKAHKQLFTELCAAAHTFADLSPLCLLLHSYASKRSAEDLREFILLSKVVGALIPWSSRESVKTVRQRTNDVAASPPTAGAYPLPPRPRQHQPSLNDLLGVETHVALRRYVSDADLTLALRDAIGAMTNKGNTYLQSGVRRYVLAWMRQGAVHPSPPIAFDFEGHVDADVLAMMLVEGLREARKEAAEREAHYGTFRRANPDADVDNGYADDDQRTLYRGAKGRQVEDLADLIGQDVSRSSPLRQRHHVPSPVKVRRATLTPPSSHAAAGSTMLTHGGGSRIGNGALQTPPHYRHHHRGQRMSAVSPLVVSLESKIHNISSGTYDGDGTCDSSVVHDDMVGSLMRRERAIESALRTELGRGSAVDQRRSNGDDQRHRHYDRPVTPPDDDFGPQERRRGGSGDAYQGHQEEERERTSFHEDAAGREGEASPSSTTPRPQPVDADRSGYAGSPYAANLDHMRSTLQAIEAELRRRQQADNQGSRSDAAIRSTGDTYERTGRPRPLISPPRPPPSDLSVARHVDPAASPLSPGGAASDLGDDERLLLEQLEASLMARRRDTQRSTLQAQNARRPLEEIADPFR